jgi:hypothetical protein
MTSNKDATEVGISPLSLLGSFSLSQPSLHVFPPRPAVLDRVDPADIALDLTEAIFAHFLYLAWRSVVSNGVSDLGVDNFPATNIYLTTSSNRIRDI